MIDEESTLHVANHRTMQLLGGFRVRSDGHLLMLPDRARRVLACVALIAGDATRREIAGRLWPDVTQARANADLRTTLWRLQRLGAGLVVTTGDMLSLGEVSVDVHAVEEWIQTAIAPPVMLGEHPSTPPPGAGRVLLSGWDDEWLEQPRERLRLLQLQAFESLAGRLLASGRLAEALPHAITVVQASPLRESANQLMVEIHLRQGNVAEAVHHFELYQDRLRRELGVDPGLAITSLLGRFLPTGVRKLAPSS